MLTITSPPLKEVRELAQRSMCIGGDVCIYFPKQNPNYQTLTKYLLHRTKILTVLCIA